MPKRLDPMATQLEKRLEELFGEDESVAEPIEEMPETLDEVDFLEGENILTQLKSLVYSIEWEVNDNYLNELISEVERLKEEFQDDRYLQVLFKMIVSVSNYILKRKANAHPNSISLLKAIYEGIEKLVVEEGITEEEKNWEVSSLLTRFNELKEALRAKSQVKAEEESAISAYARPEIEQKGIIASKEEVPGQEVGYQEEGSTDTGKEGSDKGNRPDPYEAFQYALEEIKEVIRAEMRAIRAELRLWRDSLRIER